MEQLMEQLNYLLEKCKSEPEMEYLNSIRKSKIFKVKNILLKFDKDFRELKNREIKIKKRNGTPIYESITFTKT